MKFQKKGSFFAIEIFFITVFLCLVVVFFFSKGQADAPNSLVSPGKVLIIRYELGVYEIIEQEIILESLEETSKEINFGEDGFAEEFRGKFLEKFSAEKNLNDFIFSGLVVSGGFDEDDARVKTKEFYDGALYPLNGLRMEGNTLFFKRGPIGKEIWLNADDQSKINFPVDFYFEYGREYRITFKDGKFLVE